MIESSISDSLYTALKLMRNKDKKPTIQYTGVSSGATQDYNQQFNMNTNAA